jgi:hypothetical protein
MVGVFARCANTADVALAGFVPMIMKWQGMRNPASELI